MAVRLIDGGNDNDQFVISNAVKGDGPIGCKGGDGTGCFPIEGRDNDFPISNYELGPEHDALKDASIDFAWKVATFASAKALGPAGPLVVNTIRVLFDLSGSTGSGSNSASLNVDDIYEALSDKIDSQISLAILQGDISEDSGGIKTSTEECAKNFGYYSNLIEDTETEDEALNDLGLAHLHCSSS